LRVLVVCSGNICRSPMAAAYLRHRARHAGIPSLIVDSRGLLGIEGEPADANARRVAAENGFDLNGHRSRGLRPDDVRSADLVLAMSLDHLDELQRRFPGDVPPRRLLRAFEQEALPRGGAPDLPDPVGGPVEAFRESFETIRTCVDHLVLYLKHLP
jgi:protein-tyrosine-phosphatase